MVFKNDIKYKWSNNIIPIDAQTVGMILSNIYEEKGKVTIELIIEEAHRKKSPLHEYFIWDDIKAGELYRKQQARRMIQEIRIVKYHNNIQQDVKAFVSVMTEEGKNYQPIVKILENDELRKQIIIGAKKNIKYWANELKKFKEFAKIVMKIEQIMLDLDEFNIKE